MNSILRLLNHTPIRSLFSVSRILLAKPSSVIKNENIPAQTISLISVDGKALGQVSLKEALRTLDRSLHDLIMVSKATNVPICKIVSKKQLFEQQRKKASKAPGSVHKELEVSTVITDHDLEIKLRKAREFLLKGYRLQWTVLKRTADPFDPIVEKIELGLSGVGKLNASSQPTPRKRILLYLSTTKP